MAWHTIIECSCDHCGRHDEIGYPSKQAQWDYLKHNGWQRHKGQHLCFECAYQITGNWTAWWERSEDDAYKCCRYHHQTQ